MTDTSRRDPGKLELDIEALADLLWRETWALADYAESAAIAEAEYRSAFAAALLRTEGGTVAEREATARQATDEQYLRHRIAEAKERAQLELVRTLRSEVDVARTMRADQRKAT